MKKPTNQTDLFKPVGRLGTLEPNLDPYLSQKSRTNDIKRQHYESIINNRDTMRKMDYIFCVLHKYGKLTDSEIQVKIKERFNVWIKDHLIPARRADITNANKGTYKYWRIIVAEHRECKIMKTVKISWMLKRI